VAAMVMAGFCAWYTWPVVGTATDAMFFTAVAFLAAAVTARAMQSRAAIWWVTAGFATMLAIAARPPFAIYAAVLLGLFAFTRRTVLSIWWALATATSV